MSLNPGGSNYSWNYSKPDKPNFTETIMGTVVALQEVQSRRWSPGQQGPGAPEFWDDGKPKMNIRMLMVQQDGTFVSFTFQPAGKAARQGQKRSVHMDLFALTGNTDMTQLIGKTITITTYPGQYGQGNPRPFDVSLANVGPFTPLSPIPSEYTVPELLANDGASGGQAQPQYAAPQNIQQPQVAQPAMSAQPAMHPQQMAQPATQPAQQMQMSAQMPAGMDPQVAAAMQNLGATNVQPVTGEVYDEDIPF